MSASKDQGGCADTALDDSTVVFGGEAVAASNDAKKKRKPTVVNSQR